MGRVCLEIETVMLRSWWFGGDLRVCKEPLFKVKFGLSEAVVESPAQSEVGFL